MLQTDVSTARAPIDRHIQVNTNYRTFTAHSISTRRTQLAVDRLQLAVDALQRTLGLATPDAVPARGHPGHCGAWSDLGVELSPDVRPPVEGATMGIAVAPRAPEGAAAHGLGTLGDSLTHGFQHRDRH